MLLLLLVSLMIMPKTTTRHTPSLPPPHTLTQVVSEFLHTYIFDKLRTQSQVISPHIPSPLLPSTPPPPPSLQLGYVVQAWCARKHGIGRIRVLVQSQMDELHVEAEMLKVTPVSSCRNPAAARSTVGIEGFFFKFLF